MTTAGMRLDRVRIQRHRHRAAAMVAAGCTHGEIARELGVTRRTVERYLARIRRGGT